MTAPFPSDRVPRNNAGKLDWLRLARSENVGPVTFVQLMRRYGSAGEALEALPHLARSGGARRLRVASKEAAEHEVASAQAAGARMILLGSDAYPENLAALDAPPPLLWCLGDPALVQARTVAIVGARNASALGLKFAEILARDLGKAGWSVVSGLARGVDAAAHRGALESGTVAVLAGGVDVMWPPQNEALYREIVEKGAVLSERAMGHQGRAPDFPRRNRIVSGLALGAVVAEGAERSGSLITARFAGEQGREVMAAPGSPLDPRAGGCNRLIREGATLVRGIDDVLEALSHYGSVPRMAEPLFEWAEAQGEADDTLRREVEDALGVVPVEIDELVRLTGAGSGLVAHVLLELDLAGRLRRDPGGKVALLPGDEQRSG